jgi:hypothetical protein
VGQVPGPGVPAARRNVSFRQQQTCRWVGFGPLSAISRHMHCSKIRRTFRPSSAGTSSVVDKGPVGRTLRVTNAINSLGQEHPEF